jgi:formate C-acetyltransferase
LKDALFANPREISLERALLYTASHQQTEGEPVIIRRAKATAYILDHVNIAIRDEELIAGNRTVKPRAGLCRLRWIPTGCLRSWTSFHASAGPLRHQRRG